MPEYFTSQLGTERTFDILQSGYHHVCNLSAPFTDEVIVRLYPSIEPVEGTPEVQMGDFPLLLEDSKVPVHCPQAQGREFLFQSIIDPTGCGMSVGASQKFQDPLTLFTGTIRFHTPSLNYYIISKVKSTGESSITPLVKTLNCLSNLPPESSKGKECP
jgi:hypothetical protein